MFCGKTCTKDYPYRQRTQGRDTADDDNSSDVLSSRAEQRAYGRSKDQDGDSGHANIPRFSRRMHATYNSDRYDGNDSRDFSLRQKQSRNDDNDDDEERFVSPRPSHPRSMVNGSYTTSAKVRSSDRAHYR